MAVAGAGGVGNDTDPVVVAAPGHADVEVLAGGGAIGEEHGPVDGDPFGLVDRHGVSKSDVLGRVAGGEDDPAMTVEVGDDQGAVLAAVLNVPAVSVADPPPRIGEEAAVVAGGDDLVALADDLGSGGDPVRFDLPGGDPFGPGPQGAGIKARHWAPI